MLLSILPMVYLIIVFISTYLPFVKCDEGFPKKVTLKNVDSVDSYVESLFSLNATINMKLSFEIYCKDYNSDIFNMNLSDLSFDYHTVPIFEILEGEASGQVNRTYLALNPNAVESNNGNKESTLYMETTQNLKSLYRGKMRKQFLDNYEIHTFNIKQDLDRSSTVQILKKHIRNHVKSLFSIRNVYRNLANGVSTLTITNCILFTLRLAQADIRSKSIESVYGDGKLIVDEEPGAALNDYVTAINYNDSRLIFRISRRIMQITFFLQYVLPFENGELKLMFKALRILYSLF
eukprot:Pgem_evm1s1451